MKISGKMFCVAVAWVAGVGQALAKGYGAEYYRSPVGFAITLAGNVGEIRSNHFHTGLDIKALQGVGSPVYAVADGYVSRVGVSPTGYGHVLYVTHPNGETSVYGHLNAFAPEIARWVREQQYAKRSFRVDLHPERERFPVRKGERIAFLGNTGSSGGPHLHFEIRDAQGRPRNLVAEGVYRVSDRVVPAVSRILLYEVNTAMGIPYRTLRRSVAVRTSADGTAVPEDSVLVLNGRGYLAYEVIDYKDGKSNTMGLYAMEQRVDSVTNFRFAIDRVNFATNGYVNAFVDFAENRRARRTSVLRAYVAPHNRLTIYGVRGDGIIDLSAAGTATGRRQVETIFTGDAGNRTTLRFGLVRSLDGERCEPEPVVPQGEAVLWSVGRTFRVPGAEVEIPGGALYESAILRAERDTLGGRSIVRVGSADVPLHRSAKIALRPDSVSERLRAKALLVAVDELGRIGSIGGRWEAASGRVVGQTKRLGCFAVAVDTLSPTIKAELGTGATLSEGRSLRWEVTDDLSGVSYYTLSVDGQWELLAWDPKSRTMEHRPVRGTAPRRHGVVLTVSDAKGNVKTWKGTYVW